MTIGQRIRELLEKTGEKPTHFAERMPDASSRRNFWRILEDNGTSDPRLSTACVIADLLGVSLDDLRKGVEFPERTRER